MHFIVILLIVCGFEIYLSFFYNFLESRRDGSAFSLLRYFLRVQRFYLECACVIYCRFLVRAKRALSLKVSEVSNFTIPYDFPNFKTIYLTFRIIINHLSVISDNS